MINVIESDGFYEVWTDTPEGRQDGRCIGSCKVEIGALAEGINELRKDLAKLEVLLATAVTTYPDQKDRLKCEAERPY